MDILTTADFQQAILDEHLDEVIDGDTTLLDTAELIAVGEVTGYLDVRYDATECFDRSNATQFNGIHTVIQKLVDITLYHLHSRVMPNNVPELRETRYNNAINWLEKVASGYIAPKLPVKPVDPKTPLRYGNSSTSENKYY